MVWGVLPGEADGLAAGLLDGEVAKNGKAGAGWTAGLKKSRVMTWRVAIQLNRYAVKG
jgi:hypothetical protein